MFNSILDGGSKSAEVTSKLLYMIAKDNLPLRTVEKEGFQTFVKTIIPLYTIPSRKTVTHLLIEKYKYLSSIVKEEMHLAKNICLTTDVWTDSLNAKSFLGITSHYLLNNKYKSVTIGVTDLVERHTAENLQQWLLSNIVEWNIQLESIVAITSDNGANIKKAIIEGFGLDKYFPCFAHTLNLVPSRIIEKDETVSELCRKVKAIVAYFKKSVAAMDQLRAQSDLKLIQSVDTRWNSTHDMLVRFVELSDVISLILLQIPKAPTMLNAFELQIIKEFIQILEPFKSATTLICGENYVTASKVIPLVQMIKSKLQSFAPSTEEGHHIKKILLEEFTKRFKDIEEVTLAAISTILDPRFKKIYFENKIACSRAINKISIAINKIALKNRELKHSVETSNILECSTNKNTDFWTFHDQVVNNLNNTKNSIDLDSNQMAEDLKYYLHQNLIKKTECPINYWKNLSDSPLSQIAMRYLTVIATSVPSERLFSKAGRIMSESRNRIKGKHLQALLFLSSLGFDDWFI